MPMREHFNSTNNNGCPYIRDYPGNVRSVFDALGNLVEVNDYYPYGALMNTLADNPSQQPYKYGAKELDRTAGLDLYDSQARQYDPLLGRTTTVDPHSSAYFPTSHYVWCAGNPIRNIDPDGQKIIFINGYIGFGSPPEGEPYWNGIKSNFVKGAKSFFKDQEVVFTDKKHDLLSSAKDRERSGYEYAKKNYKKWIKNMLPDEAFNLVSHSMGGAFSKGIEIFIKEKGRKVKYNVMINTFQIKDIDNPKSGETIYIDYQNTNDPVLKVDIVGRGALENADYKIREKSEDVGLMGIHRYPINWGYKFWQTISNAISDKSD